MNVYVHQNRIGQADWPPGDQQEYVIRHEPGVGHKEAHAMGNAFGDVIGIIVLTLHDYLRYCLSRRERECPKGPKLRRVSRAQRRAWYATRYRRGLPYTGVTRRLKR